MDGEAPTTVHTNGASPPTPTGSALADEIAAIVAAIKADEAAHADPAIVARAGALSELGAAQLMRDLRGGDEKVRSRVVDTFAAAVKRHRVAREHAEATAAAEQRKASREPSWRDQITFGDNGRPLACFANACLFLEHIYAGRLSYDIMAERPCLDGQPLDDRTVSRVRLHLGRTEGAHFGEEDIAKALTLIGFDAHAFHPVREYLEDCRRRWDGKKRLDEAASMLLNVPSFDHLSRIMVKRTLIAAVARAINPGEKVDTILILVGFQGAKKSSFFSVLGGQWFGASKVDLEDRKGMIVMASRWIYEWPEIDRVFRKHDNSAIKAFISQEVDHFVPMYGHGSVALKRSWIPVGTTNQKHFLTDVTGDRRVWAIDLHGNGPDWQISAEKVAEYRDQLFGEAVAEYEAFQELAAKGCPGDQNPHRWWLDRAEEDQRQGRVSEHRVESPWTETVGSWLAGEPVRCQVCGGTRRIGQEFCSFCKGAGAVKRDEALEPLPKSPEGRVYVTPRLVMEKALGIPPERFCGHGTRIAETLAELGWHAGKRREVKGVKITPYYSPAANEEADVAEAERDAIAEEPRAP